MSADFADIQTLIDAQITELRKHSPAQSDTFAILLTFALAAIGLAIPLAVSSRKRKD